jgi:peptidyl-prolyl cis-trans isomerase D
MGHPYHPPPFAAIIRIAFMLQQLRRLPKWVAGIAFLPLIISFGFWGISGNFTGGGDTSVATVGSTKIEYDEFSRTFANIRRNATERAGGQLSQAQVAMLGKKTLEHEISDTALDNAASDLGLMTTDDQVSSAIRTIPAFHGPLGAFDQQAFAAAIQRLNYTPAGFVAEVRRELTRDQVIGAATAALALPPDYIGAFFSYANERRAVQYVILPPDAAGAIALPSDEVLQAYVNAHAATFSTPEYRELTYATISPDDVASQMPVTDAQIHQTYDLRKDVFNVPDRRDIQRINFPDEASAKAARAKIDGGAKFEDIAAQRGTTPSDLNLGSLSQADLGPTQGPAAFALPVNGISQPVKYTFGWSLLRVTKITPGTTKTFDDVKAEIKAELTQQLAGSKVEDIVNAFDDARNAGDDLTEAAKKAGMHVVHVAATDEHGLAPDGTKANVPASPEFLAQVFKSDIGTEGDPFATTDLRRYVLKIDGVTPSKLKPLAAVRAQATADWTTAQRRIKLASVAAGLVARVNSGAALQSIASEYRATVQTYGPLLRDQPTPAINAALNTKIFASPPGKAVVGPAADGNGYVVAWISGVLHPPVPFGDPNFASFGRKLGVSDDIQESMGAAERARQGVKTNQQQADRVIGGEGS